MLKMWHYVALSLYRIKVKATISQKFNILIDYIETIAIVCALRNRYSFPNFSQYDNKKLKSHGTRVQCLSWLHCQQRYVIMSDGNYCLLFIVLAGTKYVQ